MVISFDVKMMVERSLIIFFLNPGDHLQLIYQLICTANPANFNSNRAWLADLISW